MQITTFSTYKTKLTSEGKENSLHNIKVVTKYILLSSQIKNCNITLNDNSTEEVMVAAMDWQNEMDTCQLTLLFLVFYVKGFIFEMLKYDLIYKVFLLVTCQGLWQ